MSTASHGAVDKEGIPEGSGKCLCTCEKVINMVSMGTPGRTNFVKQSERRLESVLYLDCRNFRIPS